MRPTDAQTALAFLAMLIVGAIAGLLIFFRIPSDNKELLTFALGALAGALTVGGGSKLADRIITSPTPPADPGPQQ